MASAVEPEYAPRMRLTTVPAVPYPAGAVVSRAPKMWVEGHWRLARTAASTASPSTGEPLTSSECAVMRRKAILGVGHMLTVMIWRWEGTVKFLGGVGLDEMC